MVNMIWGTTCVNKAYGAQRNGGSCQTNEPSIPGMRLMDSISIVVTKLLDYLLDLIKLLAGSKISYNPFEAIDTMG